jgi:hypothetical protein
MAPRKADELMELVREGEGLSTKAARPYLHGMYTLDREVDMECTRKRILSRWARGIDRGMLREYKVLYSMLGHLLERVGER